MPVISFQGNLMPLNSKVIFTLALSCTYLPSYIACNKNVNLKKREWKNGETHAHSKIREVLGETQKISIFLSPLVSIYK